MKSAVSIAIILIFAVPSLAADLQVLDLQYTAAGRLVANIFNQAADGIEDDITVKFYDNGNEIGIQTYTDPLPRYSVFSVYVDYIPAVGLHEFRALADPGNMIAESKEDNNGKSISFEQKIDNAPRNATPEPKKEEITEETKLTETTGIQAPRITSGEVTMLLLGVVAVLVLLLLVRMLHIRGRIRMPKTEDGGKGKRLMPFGKTESGKLAEGWKWRSGKKEDAGQEKGGKGFGVFSRGKNKPEKTSSRAGVKMAMAMKAGSSARLNARLTFNGKVGDDYTYFLKDESGETVGISKEKLPDGQQVIECVVENFMKDDKVLRIRSAK
ncbi:MAG: hypothetical protein HYW27_01450 [Candidatus Aenigmarchaeota archaeon]|nr:hypothetical protein [Candidatus Aenigmarchaeota archaeon]